jgi:hypothetical protein
MFTRKDHLQRYLRKLHIRTNANVQSGGGVDTTPDGKRTDFSTNNEPCNIEALGGALKTHIINAEGLNKFDPMTFLKHRYEKIKDVIKQNIKERGGIKWYLSMKIKMSRRKGDANETAELHFRAKCQTSLKIEDTDERVKESIRKMYTSFIEFQRQGRNWTTDKVVNLTIHMACYRPLKGSSYIPLPIKLRSKHAIINIKNKDNKCFMWSVLAALYPVQRDGERVWKYKDHESDLNVKDISFPVKMDDIPKFEKHLLTCLDMKRTKFSPFMLHEIDMNDT